MRKHVLEIVTLPNIEPLLVVMNDISFVDVTKSINEILITNIHGVKILISFLSKDEMMRCNKFIREILTGTGTDHYIYNLFVEGDPQANNLFNDKINQDKKDKFVCEYKEEPAMKISELDSFDDTDF